MVNKSERAESGGPFPARCKKTRERETVVSFVWLFPDEPVCGCDSFPRVPGERVGTDPLPEIRHDLECVPADNDLCLLCHRIRLEGPDDITDEGNIVGMVEEIATTSAFRSRAAWIRLCAGVFAPM